jgi:hypothetical protein
MRAKEFITEIATVGILKVGDLEFYVDRHSFDQAVRRNVLPSDIDRVLKKMPGIKEKLEDIPGGQQFWVYDPALKVGVGFRKIKDDLFRFILKTVVGSRPFDGPNPIITLENFADGKRKGKSRPGRVKRAGASCKGSVSDLRARAKKYSGERGKMYHWCANMKSGKNK